MKIKIGYSSSIKETTWSEQEAEESLLKGYRNDVLVTVNNLVYKLYFIDPTRLKQDLDSEIAIGYPYLAIPNLIVISSITQGAIEQTVEVLHLEGYFNSIKPSFQSI